jgi:hypothetical protein
MMKTNLIPGCLNCICFALFKYGLETDETQNANTARGSSVPHRCCLARLRVPVPGTLQRITLSSSRTIRLTGRERAKTGQTSFDLFE